jgi:hypothetical protein
MGLHRKNIGAVEEVLIRAWIVRFHPLDQFELPDHAVLNLDLAAHSALSAAIG